MINVTICGIAGKMGREVVQAAAECEDIKISAGLEVSGHHLIGKKLDGIDVFGDVKTAVGNCDCIVDFTNHEVALSILTDVKSDRKPFISGTTGFTDHDIRKIMEVSKKIPVFIAPNMSLGVSTLYDLIEHAVKNIPDFDIEIVETHHRMKKDAPSGTARAIIDLVKANRPELKTIAERRGIIGARRQDEMGVFAIRGGDVVGEHRVLFLGSGEFIELRHFATSRRCFAQGALAAVRFIINRKPGFYTMADLLKTRAGLTNK